MKQCLTLGLALVLFFVCVTTAFALPTGKQNTRGKAELEFWIGENVSFH